MQADEVNNRIKRAVALRSENARPIGPSRQRIGAQKGSNSIRSTHVCNNTPLICIVSCTNHNVGPAAKMHVL